MNSFDESKVRRATDGKFTNKPYAESDVVLAADEPNTVLKRTVTEKTGPGEFLVPVGDLRKGDYIDLEPVVKDAYKNGYIDADQYERDMSMVPYELGEVESVEEGPNATVVYSDMGNWAVPKDSRIPVLAELDHEFEPMVENVVDDCLVAALWTSEDDLERNSESDDFEPPTINDFAPETRSEMELNIRRFMIENEKDLKDAIESGGLSFSQIGHDFWLTSNHHGAGFWDRGLGDAGERLTDSAQGFGELDLFQDEDGTVYAE